MRYAPIKWTLLMVFMCTYQLLWSQDKPTENKSKPSAWDINPYSNKNYKNPTPADKEAVMDAFNKKKGNNSQNQNNKREPGSLGGNRDFSDANQKKDDIFNEEEFNNTTINNAVDSQFQIYGMSFFSNFNYAQGNQDIITPPSSYRLGYGDEIIVNIWGPSEEQFSYEVGRDGSIYPRYFGKISVGGLTFAHAKQIIVSRFKKQISPGSNVDVQLGKARNIKVTVMGEVKRPGTITMGAFNSALSAVSMAGGPTNLANLRNIEIKRNGSIVNTIDLYEFIRSGGSLDDLYLDDGDLINVPVYDKLVMALGSFKRPMSYILKSDETLDDLILFAGGPTSDARYSNIQIKSVINEETKLLTVDLNVYETAKKTLLLYDGDEVKINKVNPFFTNTVEVIGAVKYPDIYQVKPEERLLSIISKAGGLEGDAMATRAYVYRGDPDLPDSYEIDLTNLKESDKNNIVVLPGDRISIISKSIFKNKYSIEVIGSVRKPGTVSYFKNMTLKDLLILAGGLQSEAENGRIEIVSVVDSANKIYMSTKPNPDSKIININPDLEIDRISEEILLNPFDKVYVRKKSDFELTKKVTLIGEVKYPGEYALLDDNETISSLIKRAGGLTRDAYSEGTEFRRSKISNRDRKILTEALGIVEENFEKKADIKDSTLNKIQLEKNLTASLNDLEITINLAKAIANPNSEYDIILKENDIITIPTTNDIVSIIGNIQNPTSFKFTRETDDVRKLIASSGGAKERTDYSKIMVSYPGGVMKKTKNYVVYKSYPKVTPGSIVIVPVKKDKAKKENDKSAEKALMFTTALTTVTTGIITILRVAKIIE